MLVTRNREKLVNAIVYFATNTCYCSTTKLFRLLYLLDFQHFRVTGTSVTGMEYRAWKHGPIPFKLVQEWDEFEPDLASAIHILPEPVFDYDRLRIEAKAPFDDRHFTKRELGLMQELAARYRDEMTKPLVSLTHEQRRPWDKIWDGGRGNDARIPYSLAIPDDGPNREAVLQAASEYEAIHKADVTQH